MQFDDVIETIADYAVSRLEPGELALQTAEYTLIDSIGCALLALNYPACTKLLGPEIDGTAVPDGSRVPGTAYVLEPMKAAFDTGACIRWLDFNDTWLAAEWGHPSDNYGAILGVADHLSQANRRAGRPPISVRDVLIAGIKAYEIQGILALSNSFNRVGIDHVVLVKVASTAVVAALMGADRSQAANAVSNAWLDATLRTYRHAPNTGSRKSWAAGDACARAVKMAQMAVRGEMGYASALTAQGWGFQDVWFSGEEITLTQSLSSYVMENVLFKISFPAEFHAQTAVEAAFALHPEVANRLDEIEKITITTQEPAIRIIDKTGPLTNPADRDHCIQYMTAVGLLKGELTAADYEDDAASDPRIDALRAKMVVVEDTRYTADYLDPSKRSIANAVQVEFKDGTSTAKIEVEYPIGHRRRREEGIPLLKSKFGRNLRERLSGERSSQILDAIADSSSFHAMPIDDVMGLLAAPGS